MKETNITDPNDFIIKNGVLRKYKGKAKSVVIPSSVVEIDRCAFDARYDLTSITIPESVTQIGVLAFRDCTSLTSLTIPDSVTEIGEYAFYGCTGLTSITIPDSVTEIEKSAFFGCTGLTSITIPDSVTKIGESAFEGCTGLTSITIPDSVTVIGWDAFRGCTSLTSITIPDSVTEIRHAAFSGCTGLTSITIPDSVTEIEDYAFKGCTGLTSITIPDSVTEISYAAFYGCTGLTSITIPDSVTEIGESAFQGCTGMNSINVSQKNKDYKSIDGVLYFADASGLVMCPNGKSSVSIPNSVEVIAPSAFFGCTGLTSITIPDTVTEIGRTAFDGCTGLTSITIPNSVKKIEYATFRGCTGLTSITIPDTVTEIGSSAFEGCTGLTSITIPSSIKLIEDGAFEGCSSLTTITFSGEVKKIVKRTINFFAKSKVKVVNVPAASLDVIRAAFPAKVKFNVMDESTKNKTTKNSSTKKASSTVEDRKVTVEIEGIVSRARLQHMSDSDAAEAKKAIAALGSSKFSEAKKAGLVGDGALFYDAEETETFIVKVNSLSLDGQEFNPFKLCCTADKVLACPVPVHEPGVYWAALHEVCYDGREGGIIVQFDQYPEAEPRTYTCEIELGEGEEFDISKLSFGPAYNPCLDSRHKYTGKSDVYINADSLTYNGKEYELESDPAFDEDDFADAGLYHELEMGFVEVEKTENGTLTYKVIKGWTGDYNLKRYDVD